MISSINSNASISSDIFFQTCNQQMPGSGKEFIYVMCFAQWGLSPSLSSKTKHWAWYAIKPCDHFYCEHLPFKPYLPVSQQDYDFFMSENTNIEEYNSNRSM